MNSKDAFRMPVWYKKLYKYSFPAVFVEMDETVLSALKERRVQGKDLDKFFLKLKDCMSNFSGARFISVDTVAPTDTERFILKRGSVHSASSAWNILCFSDKVHTALNAGMVSSICIRPFRNMQPAREFRLFIKDGKLVGMSQYWLIRHFYRLPARLERYWKLASAFVGKIADSLPVKDVALDIYFTKESDIMIIDLNPWGEPTSPLMYNTWERDWTEPGKCEIVPAPRQVSGDVNVHF